MIQIPPCLLLELAKPQKLTRTLSYHLTPFKLTLAVDLDTFNCEDLQPVLRRVFTADRLHFDIAAAGHKPDRWHPDHGIKLMWWSDTMRQLLIDWERSQVQRGIETSDQSALMAFLRKNPNAPYRFARLPTALSCRIRPAVGESFSMAWSTRSFSQSLPIYGPLYILHMDGLHRAYRQLCDMANREKAKTRVMTYKHNHSFFPGPPDVIRATFHAVTTFEECDRELSGHCFTELDWAPRPFAIEPVPRTLYQF